MKKGQKFPEKHYQLCWDCEKACGRCSWSRDFTPVPGWKAKPSKIVSNTTEINEEGKTVHRKVYVDSFDVYECPEFEPLQIKNEEERKKMLKRMLERNGEFLRVFKKVLEL